MCGRYQFTAEQSAEILQIIQEVQKKFGTKAASAIRRGEIGPGCKMPVFIPSAGGQSTELYIWGFRTGKQPVINARAETIREKPMFREDIAARRCVIPATGFYETDGDGRKVLFTMPESGILYMAGIYEVRGGLPCFCIITTEPNDSVRMFHDRMPIVLTEEQLDPWMTDAEATEYYLSMTPPLLKAERQDAQIGLW